MSGYLGGRINSRWSDWRSLLKRSCLWSPTTVVYMNLRMTRRVSRDSRRLTGGRPSGGVGGRDSGGADELVGDEENTGETSSAGVVVNKKGKETEGVGDTVEEGEA